MGDDVNIDNILSPYLWDMDEIILPADDLVAICSGPVEGRLGRGNNTTVKQGSAANLSPRSPCHNGPLFAIVFCVFPIQVRAGGSWCLCCRER